jgi:error-prone DNA polymerase
MGGANIEAPCVNNSRYTTHITGQTIYLGFSAHQGTGISGGRIVACRTQSPWDIPQSRRLSAPRFITLEQLEILILIHAFRFTGISKQALLIEAYMRLNKTKKTRPALQLFDGEEEPDYHFPALHAHELEDAWDQVRILGFPLLSPFLLIDPTYMNKEQSVTAADIPANKGKIVTVLAYYVTRKVTYTIKGEIMFFGTFIDRDGDWIDTVHFPDVAKKYRFRGKGLLSDYRESYRGI